MTTGEIKKREDYCVKLALLAQAVIMRTIDDHTDENGHLKPQPLYAVLALLKSIIDRTFAIHILLASDKIVDASILSRILTEAFVNLCYIADPKHPPEMWDTYFTDYVNDLCMEAEERASAYGISIEEAFQRVPIYKAAAEYRADPQFAHLFSKEPDDFDRLSNKLGDFQDQIKSLGAGNGDIADPKEIKLARLLAQIQMAKKKRKWTGWRHIDMEQKEKVVFGNLDSTFLKQMSAMRFNWNLHVHSSPVALFNDYTIMEDGVITLEIGQLVDDGLNNSTWKSIAAFAAGAVKEVALRYPTDPEFLLLAKEALRNAAAFPPDPLTL